MSSDLQMRQFRLNTYTRTINYQNLLLNIGANKPLLLLIVLISVLHAFFSIRSSSDVNTYYMSFGNRFHDKIAVDIDTTFASKKMENLNLPLNSPDVLILHMKSRNFAKRLSDDRVVREYFFPNNFGRESNSWINPPLELSSKIKNTVKYILAGLKYEPKNVEEVEKFLWAFLNSKLKLSYNAERHIFEVWLNGVSIEFSEFFFTLLIHELNNLYYDEMKTTLDHGINWTEIQFQLYSGKNINKYLVNNLKILNLYKLVFNDEPPVIFKKVDSSLQKNDPLLGVFAVLFVSVFRGFIFGVMLILFKYKFRILVDSRDYSDGVDVNGALPVDTKQI